MRSQRGGRYWPPRPRGRPPNRSRQTIAPQIIPFNKNLTPAAFPSLPLTDPADSSARLDNNAKEQEFLEVDSDGSVDTAINTFASEPLSTSFDVAQNYSYPGEDGIAFDTNLVSWESLELFYQTHIFKAATARYGFEEYAGIALHLTQGQFDAIREAINLRKIHNISFDDAWMLCAAQSGYGGMAIDPDHLQENMGLLQFADSYEYATVAGHENAKRFLRQYGIELALPIVYEDDDKAGIQAINDRGYEVTQTRTQAADNPVLSQQESPDRDATVSASPQSTIRKPRKSAPFPITISKILETNETRSRPLGSSLPRLTFGNTGDHPTTSRNNTSGQGCLTSPRVPIRRVVDPHYYLQFHENLVTTRQQNLSAPQNISLMIDHETGRAAVVRQSSGHIQPLQSHQLVLERVHPDHQFFTFAEHFQHQHFPIAEKIGLLLTAPTIMTESERWLLYGDVIVHKILPLLTRSQSMRSDDRSWRACLVEGTPSNTRSTASINRLGARILNIPVAKRCRSFVMIKVHSAWVREHYGNITNMNTEVINHLDRVWAISLENIKNLTAIDKGESQSFKHCGAGRRGFWTSTDPSCLAHVLRGDAKSRHNLAIFSSRKISERNLQDKRSTGILGARQKDSTYGNALLISEHTQAEVDSNTLDYVNTQSSSGSRLPQSTGARIIQPTSSVVFSSRGLRSSTPARSLPVAKSTHRTRQIGSAVEARSPEPPDFSPISDYAGTDPWEMNHDNKQILVNSGPIVSSERIQALAETARTALSDLSVLEPTQ